MPKATPKLVASASASVIAKAHTLFSVCAFSTALLLGVSLHFQKIVKNQIYRYIVSNVPWMIGSRSLLAPPTSDLSSTSPTALRGYFAAAFFSTLVPLVFFYIKHKVHAVAGAYSIYALFEWSLIALDIAFDAVVARDFARLELRIVDVGTEAATTNRTFHLGPPLTASNPEFDGIGQLSRLVSALSTGAKVTRTWRNFFADSFMAFVFWSNLTALGPMIFYRMQLYPSGGFQALTEYAESVWSMGLSGDEVLLFCTLSPVFLLSSNVQNFVIRHPALIALVELGGVAAYKIDDEGEQRLRTLGFVLAVGVLGWTAKWRQAVSKGATRDSTDRLTLTFTIGLLLSVLAKHSFFSINPVWPFMSDENGGHMANGGLNGLALKIGLLAILDIAVRPARVVVAPPPPKPSRNPPPPCPSSLSAYGTGAILFLIHFLFTDSGTIIAWAQKGHPTGPTANPHGVLTLVALSAGTLLSTFPSIAPFVSSTPAYLLSALAAAILLTQNGWISFVAGCGLGTYTLAVLPSFLAATAQLGIGGFLKAFLTYNIFVLASVWVVAYAFVPAGALLRERTDLVLGGVMLLIGGGVFDLQRIERDRPSWGRGTRKFASKARIALVAILLTSVAVATQFISYHLNMYSDIGPSPSQHTWGCALLSKFPILNSTHLLLPSPVGELAPAIHATLDVYGTLVDVVVSHNGQEEDARDRELQSAELARIMREAWPRPVVFLGYVVTKPLANRPAPYQLLVEDGRMQDVDASDDDRWCEYILWRGLHRVAYARLNRGSNPAITDTEIQLAKFVVAEPDASSGAFHTPSADDARRTYLPLVKRRALITIDLTEGNRVQESLVDEAHRFPAMFYGAGVRGHRYQVLRDQDGRLAPRYYMERMEAAQRLADSIAPPECKTQ
ncbi:hypothetical protein RQP46_003952 [Phenoliferia psychrophenolica]